MTMTKTPSRNAWYTYGHGPLLILLQIGNRPKTWRKLPDLRTEYKSCVARELLQGRPLQLPMGWGVGEELTKSRSTFEQLCVQNLALAISYSFSPTKSVYKIRLARS